MQKYAVVIGGGIGGLSAAIGLRKAGWRVSIFERVPEFRAVGAGITLWPNALRSLAELGLAAELEPLIVSPRGGTLRAPDGTQLTRWNRDHFENSLGGSMVGLHRAQLLDLLRSALPAESLRGGVTVQSVSPTGQVITDIGTETADLVVCADGINSKNRARLWPAHQGLASVGATAFRSVIETDEHTEFGTTWGPGTEFGIVPLVDNRIYWFTSINARQSTSASMDKSFLMNYFAHWHSPIPQLIERTDEEKILRHDLAAFASPLPSYINGRVAIIGDAAHGMAPYLGQGGAQAIEDAVVLASAVSRTNNLSTALADYDKQRRPRSQQIARNSYKIGKIGAQLDNKFAIAARNAILRLTPSSLSTKATERVIDWTPPRINENAQAH